MATLTPPKPRVFNLPNALTFARFVLALVLFGLIALEVWIWCVVVFSVAAFTDWLDGYLARRQNLTSSLGRNLDPLVDKILLIGVYIFLLPDGSKAGWLAPWMVTVVAARELVITSLRSYLENLGAKFGADWLGKLKMVLQCAAVIAIFVALEIPRRWPALSPAVSWLRDVLIWAMLLVTLVSGLQYLWKAASILKTEGLM
jgi:CDP-diacylglycerol--glycerol-3-phosphate 3-phosphatidyltransferase